jgi:hypothetical protein
MWNRTESDKCRRRADTVIRNRYKQEWNEALIQARVEGWKQPRYRADTVLRKKYRGEWKVEHEKHAKTIGYGTMRTRQARAIKREEQRLAERKAKLAG